MPVVPPRELLPNNSTHYLTKSKLKKALLLRATDAVTDDVRDLLSALRCEHGRAAWPYDLRVEVVWPKGRRTPDLDGALSSCKSLLDGVALGVEIDDRHCKEITVTQRKADRGERGCTVVTYSLHAG